MTGIAGVPVYNIFIVIVLRGCRRLLIMIIQPGTVFGYRVKLVVIRVTVAASGQSGKGPTDVAKSGTGTVVLREVLSVSMTKF